MSTTDDEIQVLDNYNYYNHEENWSDDSDWDPDGAKTWFANLGDGGGRPLIIHPYKQINAFRNQLVFACKFEIEPRMQQYYYTPDLISSSSRQLLYGSPEFDGQLRTKWQVLIDLNHWDGVTRWVSLYLSRADGNNGEYGGTVYFQCEFRVVNSEGNILKASRNFIMRTKPNDTNGFAKFLPFSDALRMISDNSLRIEAHLTVMRMWEMDKFDRLKYKRLRAQAVDGSRTDSAETVDCSDEAALDRYQLENRANTVGFFESQKYCFTFPLSEHKRVNFFLDDVFIGFASRNKLLKVSGSYRLVAEQGWFGSRNMIKFRRKGNPRAFCTNRMTIYSYLQFVEKGFISQLTDGTVEDIRLIICFADTMDTLDLMRHCINAMCRIRLKDAITVALLLRSYANLVDEDCLERFRNHFRQNLNEILKTDVAAKKLLAKESEYFVSLLLDPDPEYNIPSDSDSE